MQDRSKEAFARFCQSLAVGVGAGRPSLRRDWQHLRRLSQQALAQLPEAEVVRLLGRGREELDPERNDLKAITAYAAGRGILDPGTCSPL